ncbi:opa3 domain protein [Ophiostoma piceae UAMH 11346]|uniref:Opa3 domain protein n=1 Tax=Ophiostoma piceae (strain UAMH 11346) TaxID=1262450 RepID=S3D7N9_OPHP1|nr:opa3 domain protein [Ophiostoma piceae UAMH 11346]
MVALPLFKLGALFVRHISKYGANQIKVRAHEHVRFRAFAAKYGQHIHQLNMRMNVALLRNADAEKRAKEKAEAAETPTAKTKEEVEKEERAKAKEEATRAKYGTTAKESHPVSQSINTKVSVWRRKFRPLPEAKAVDLFADVIGDAFILGIASLLVIYEYYKSATKPDTHGDRIKELTQQLEDLQRTEEEHKRDELRRESRILAMESALRGFHDPKTKQPLLPPAPAEEPPAQTSPPVVAA